MAGLDADVPSLAAVRPMLTPRVLEWVEAVLAGEPTEAFCRARGVMPKHAPYPRYFAEAAGLPVTGVPGSIREAVLRARIRELEEAR